MPRFLPFFLGSRVIFLGHLSCFAVGYAQLSCQEKLWGKLQALACLKMPFSIRTLHHKLGCYFLPEPWRVFFYWHLVPSCADKKKTQQKASASLCSRFHFLLPTLLLSPFSLVFSQFSAVKVSLDVILFILPALGPLNVWFLPSFSLFPSVFVC